LPNHCFDIKRVYFIIVAVFARGDEGVYTKTLVQFAHGLIESVSTSTIKYEGISKNIKMIKQGPKIKDLLDIKVLY
jgi:hypothetical protein